MFALHLQAQTNITNMAIFVDYMIVQFRLFCQIWFVTEYEINHKIPSTQTEFSSLKVQVEYHHQQQLPFPN